VVPFAYLQTSPRTIGRGGSLVRLIETPLVLAMAKIAIMKRLVDLSCRGTMDRDMLPPD
jgi:hypothetical protein